jgi:hypothetical protein
MPEGRGMMIDNPYKGRCFRPELANSCYYAKIAHDEDGELIEDHYTCFSMPCLYAHERLMGALGFTVKGEV